MAVHKNENNGTNADLPTYEKLNVMRAEGWPQTLGTGRVVHLRTVEPADLLRDGECPDILTPLLLKSLYTPNRDQAVGDFLEEPFGTKENALKYMEMIDHIAGKAIADDTDLRALSFAEKKFIFRLALGSSELLVNFRLQLEEPATVVEPVAEGDDLSQAAE